MEEGILCSGKAENKALPILGTHLLQVEVYASEIHMMKSLFWYLRMCPYLGIMSLQMWIKMKPHWRWAGPNPIWLGSHKERVWTQTHTQRKACEDRGEFQVMHYQQVKEHRRLTARPPGSERYRRIFPRGLRGGNNLLTPWSQTWPPELSRQ